MANTLKQCFIGSFVGGRQKQLFGPANICLEEFLREHISCLPSQLRKENVK